MSIALRVYRHQTANRRRHAEGKGAEFSWAAIFEDVAQEHNERCNCKKRLGAGTVKTLWYENALSVIPPHLVEQSKSKKLDDILR